jgi:hypothetical protein
VKNDWAIRYGPCNKMMIKRRNAVRFIIFNLFPGNLV